MPSLFRKTPTFFDVPVEDMTLRVQGPRELYEEVRAAGMGFWEQLQSYLVRHPRFRGAKAPLAVPDDAPAIIRRMAELSALAGVGPVFTIRGAVTEHVGMELSKTLPEVVVSSGGNCFVAGRRRTRVTVREARGPGEKDLAVMTSSGQDRHGIFTTTSSEHLPARVGHDVVVVAPSCILAEAAATAALAILSKPHSFATALRYLQGLDGIQGAMVMRDRRIGLAGSLELAA